MTNWISVEDRLPSNNYPVIYAVKVMVGSMAPKEIETKVFGKPSATGFRFMTGDWERVTHWRELDES